MRRLHAGVAVSIALHAALVGWLLATGVDPRATVFANAPRIELVAVAPVDEPADLAAPVEVVLLDPVTEDMMEPGASPVAPADAHRVGPLRLTTGERPGGSSPHGLSIESDNRPPSGPAAGSPSEAPPRTRESRQPSPLEMRRGVTLRLPAARWDALDHVPAGTDAQRDPSSGLLTEDGRGHSSKTFAMRVAPDGSASLRDKRNLQLVALPTRKDVGDALRAWYAKDKFAPDPDELDHHEERPIENPIRDIGATIATFDVSDWLMRAQGGDPYASAKLRVLDATRDERAEIGTKHRRAQLARAAELMQRNLEQLWATVHDPGQRKQLLFELWNDCADPGSQDAIAASTAARAMAIGFIRRHLPAGSPDAFTPAELAMLNEGKQSTLAFTPYDSRQ